LLSSKARRRIENNGGFWPEEWNNYNSVRDLLTFNQIIVSFTGTANVSGTTVYAQQVYEYEQLAIGYTFASVIFMEQGRVVVDEELLNDVKEQPGGGAEPWDVIFRGSSSSSHQRGSVPSVELTKSAVQQCTAKSVESSSVETPHQEMKVDTRPATRHTETRISISPHPLSNSSLQL
jgi:hypothetical protein